MKTRSRKAWLLIAVMGLSMALVGCQTWIPEAGITLPSGTYLKHPPQYTPRSADFPLSKELASQEEAAARLNAAPMLP